MRFFCFKDDKYEDLYFSEERGVLVSCEDYEEIKVDSKTLESCYVEIRDVSKWVDGLPFEYWGGYAEWI